MLCAALARAQEPIRYTVSVDKTLRPGQTTTITWTITGTRKPLRLFLSVTNPASGVLEGGNVQTVTTSGGKKNFVSRRVTGLAPGSFDVTVKIDVEHDAMNPAELLAKFRREVHRIAKETNKASRRLPVDQSTVRTADVLAILDRVQNDVNRSLPQPEFAAFRDAVAAEAEELRPAPIARNRFIVLVRDGAPPADRMPAKEARSIFTKLIDLFNHAAASPVREICVVTEPAGADALLYPASFPTDRKETQSVGSLTLYLGLYAYAITSGQLRSSGTINFLEEPGAVLQCSLPHKCKLTNPPRKACP